jgi:hypothetical protein
VVGIPSSSQEKDLIFRSYSSGCTLSFPSGDLKMKKLKLKLHNDREKKIRSSSG